MLYRNGFCAKGHDTKLPGARTNDGHCRICQKGYDRNKYLVKKARLAEAKAASSQETQTAEV
jgi:hypothetical protein